MTKSLTEQPYINEFDDLRNAESNALLELCRKLEQQLAEAHNCIKHCRTHPCCQKYLDKWSVE